jgi:hypothetical protein
MNTGAPSVEAGVPGKYRWLQLPACYFVYGVTSSPHARLRHDLVKENETSAPVDHAGRAFAWTGN